MYKRILLLIILTLSLRMFPQGEKLSFLKKHTEWQGYVKYLNMVNFSGASDFMTDNLIHNRLNMRFFAGDAFSLNVGMRNRIFYGDMLKVFPSYADYIDTENDLMDLSFFPFREKSIFMYSGFDRLNLNFASGKWDISLGRQRINWGVNTVWNPNDLFNSMNFLDSDYEERPGTDALRVQYATGELSSVEVAYHPDSSFEMDRSVLAALCKFDFHSYDMQVLLANYYQDYSLGFAWAGHLQNAGFKGELNGFFDKKNAKNALVASLSLDYAFRNGWYGTISALYNSSYDETAEPDFLQLFESRLTAKNLFPSRYAFFGQLSGNMGPAWTWSMSALYGNDRHLRILIPRIAYNINEAWDIDLYGQLFFSDISGMKQRNIIFLRLRFSF